LVAAQATFVKSLNGAIQSTRTVTATIPKGATYSQYIDLSVNPPSDKDFGSSESERLVPLHIDVSYSKAANRRHTPELGKTNPYDPCAPQPMPVADEQKPYEARNSLVIHHKDVRKLDGEPGEVIDFGISLGLFFEDNIDVPAQ
jgi:hypothetical protein